MKTTKTKDLRHMPYKESRRELGLHLNQRSKWRPSCCVQYLLGGHRPNGASHFPEVQSDRLRGNKDKLQGRKFRLDVKDKKNAPSVGSNSATGAKR